jgi:hypothetical protein
MLTNRYDFSTTLLTTGKVLVAGGQSGSSVLSGAELFDPATRTFSATASMPIGRRAHVAVRLNDGRVLVAGGMDSTGKRSLALRYNPVTGAWSTASHMLTGRSSHTATLLPDGRVLVTGGSSNTASELASCELFNPNTGTWTSAAPMKRPRRHHIAALLPNGRVLVVGGDTTNTAEVYDPATNTWYSTSSPATPRLSPVGLLLADGRLLVAGGQHRTTLEPLASAELYDLATDTWSAAGVMREPRQQHTAVQLSTGKVLVFGGYNTWSGELASVDGFDPATGTWSGTYGMTMGRASNGMALLADGRVLLVGGLGTTNGRSSELYSFHECKPTTCAVWSMNCGSIPDGCGGTLDCGTCSNGHPCESNVCRDPYPSVQVTQPVPGTLLQGSVVIQANATDDLGITRVDLYVSGARIGTDSSAPYEYVWDTRAYANVDYQLYAIAYDTAGQYSVSQRVPVMVANDEQAPTATLSYPTVGMITTGTVSIQMTLSDDIALKRMELYLDGALLHSRDLDPTSLLGVGFNWDSTSVADGSHTVFARAYDLVGKVGDSAPLQFIVDNTPPTATFLSPSAGATVEGLVAISADAADERGIGRVELFVDGTFVGQRHSAPYDFTWDSRRSGTGPHTIVIRASDHTGNVTSTEVQVHIPPDVTPPTAAITEPADGTLATGWLFVRQSAADDRHLALLEFRVDGVVLSRSLSGPSSSNWDTTTLTNGPHTLVLRAYDEAGNMTDSAPVNILVGNTAPSESLTKATYDALLKAPGCASASASCDSAHLLNGRGHLGPESNAPNTLGSTCPDGATGTYHSDPSLDRLRVFTLDGTPLAAGKLVRLEATVWALGGSSRLDLYASVDASTPSWSHVATLTPSGGGQETLFTFYTLPSGSMQAVRGVLRYYQSSAGSCVRGDYNDHDDLFFAVQ